MKSKYLLAFLVSVLLISNEARAQDIGKLFGAIIKEATKGQEAKDKGESDKTVRPGQVATADLEKAWICDPHILMLWPPDIVFKEAACKEPQMSASEQQRLKSVLIAQYHLDTPERDTKEFEGGRRTVGDRAKNPEFYACLERFKQLPETVSDEEFSRVKAECDSVSAGVEGYTKGIGGIAAKGGGMEWVAPNELKSKIEEIDRYRAKIYPKAIYKRCIEYADAIDAIPENISRLEQRLPSECEPTNLAPENIAARKYPLKGNWKPDASYALSGEQYADIGSRISEKIKIAKQKLADNIRNNVNRIIVKHKSDVARMGLPSDWLKANIICIQQKYRTMEEWLSLVLDNPKIKSVTIFRSLGNYGVTVKIPQVQSQGIVFRKEGHELYPVTYVVGDESVPVRSDGDSIQIMTLLETFTLYKK